MSVNLLDTPLDLPEPADDGAAAHLECTMLPSVPLPGTDGGVHDLAAVSGVSTQGTDWQREAAERLHLPFPLLSDREGRLADALALPRFEANGEALLRRLTMIVREGRIAKVFYPVFPPERSAGDALDWLRAERAA